MSRYDRIADVLHEALVEAGPPEDQECAYAWGAVHDVSTRLCALFEFEEEPGFDPGPFLYRVLNGEADNTPRRKESAMDLYPDVTAEHLAGCHIGMIISFTWTYSGSRVEAQVTGILRQVFHNNAETTVTLAGFDATDLDEFTLDPSTVIRRNGFANAR